jgi:hypothetical protein
MPWPFFLSRLQQMHAKERDYPSALGLLGVGVDYAHGSNAQFTRILFTLSKAMVSCRLAFLFSVFFPHGYKCESSYSTLSNVREHQAINFRIKRHGSAT